MRSQGPYRSASPPRPVRETRPPWIDREAFAVLAIGAATLVPPILGGPAGAASVCLGLLVLIATLLTATLRDAGPFRGVPRRPRRKRSA